MKLKTNFKKLGLLALCSSSVLLTTGCYDADIDLVETIESYETKFEAFKNIDTILDKQNHVSFYYYDQFTPHGFGVVQYLKYYNFSFSKYKVNDKEDLSYDIKWMDEQNNYRLDYSVVHNISKKITTSKTDGQITEENITVDQLKSEYLTVVNSISMDLMNTMKSQFKKGDVTLSAGFSLEYIFNSSYMTYKTPRRSCSYVTVNDKEYDIVVEMSDFRTQFMIQQQNNDNGTKTISTAIN